MANPEPAAGVVLAFTGQTRPHDQGRATLNNLPDGVVALRAPRAPAPATSHTPLMALTLAMLTAMNPDKRELVHYRSTLFAKGEDADMVSRMIAIAESMATLAAPSKRALKLHRKDFAEFKAATGHRRTTP